uniref:Uncharacterized protein n=1 Tax=Lactuca sativa TaxID=4236 RepID=A0A9R1WBK5_LACSA|nr:hypothetical protein LSAT_V11C200051300 [Lactuca sativa]
MRVRHCLPKYKKKVDRFDCDLAIKNYRVNDVDFDPRCERNWNKFEGISNIKKQKRKDRNMEVLLANDSLSAQEWIVDVDEVDPKMVNEDLGTVDNQAPRESPRTREISDKDFKS